MRYYRSKDKRVLAIRADKLVGKGTASVVDEAMEDRELEQYLDEARIRTIEQAISWAYDQHDMWLERLSSFNPAYIENAIEWNEARKKTGL